MRSAFLAWTIFALSPAPTPQATDYQQCVRVQTPPLHEQKAIGGAASISELT